MEVGDDKVVVTRDKVIVIGQGPSKFVCSTLEAKGMKVIVVDDISQLTEEQRHYFEILDREEQELRKKKLDLTERFVLKAYPEPLVYPIDVRTNHTYGGNKGPSARTKRRKDQRKNKRK